MIVKVTSKPKPYYPPYYAWLKRVAVEEIKRVIGAKYNSITKRWYFKGDNGSVIQIEDRVISHMSGPAIRAAIEREIEACDR